MVKLWSDKLIIPWGKHNWKSVRWPFDHGLLVVYQKKSRHELKRQAATSLFPICAFKENIKLFTLLLIVVKQLFYTIQTYLILVNQFFSDTETFLSINFEHFLFIQISFVTLSFCAECWLRYVLTLTWLCVLTNKHCDYFVHSSKIEHHLHRL